MGQLKRKIREYLKMFKVKKKDQDSMKLIKWSVRYLLFCLILYLTMTFYEWGATGHANLSEFRSYIAVVGGLVVAIQGLSRWLNDSDRDGVPDPAQKESITARPPMPPAPLTSKKEETK